MKGGVVELVKTDSGAVMPAHTEFCGCVWRCPVCGGIIRRARGREIATGTQNWISAGHGAYFVTVTIRHQLGDPLAAMLDLMSDAWRRTVSGDPWKRVRQRIGLVGYVRALEITYGHGKNGWHPHYHFIFYTEEPANEQVAAYLRSKITERFSRCLERAGGKAHMPDARYAVNVQPVMASGAVGAVGSYVSKMCDGLAAEISSHDTKTGRLPAHISPWQLLDIRDGWAETAWSEYVEATSGKRSVYFSRGLRDTLGLDAEKDDDQIIEEETETNTQVIGAIEGDVWADVVDADAWWALDRALVAAAKGNWRMAAVELGVDLGWMIDSEGQQIPLLL